jgi:hypothetical protein
MFVRPVIPQYEIDHMGLAAGLKMTNDLALPSISTTAESSVFSEFGSEKPGSVARTSLRLEHAIALSKMSSKL